MKLEPNELNENVYSDKKLPKFFIVTMGIVCLLLGFILNFPFNEIISSKVQHYLATNPTCPITFKEINVNIFKNHLDIHKPTFDQRCIKSLVKPMTLDLISFDIMRPNFYPFGMRLQILAQMGTTQIMLSPTISLGTTVLKVLNTKIDLTILSYFERENAKIEGLFDVEALLNFEDGKYPSGAFFIKSKTLLIPEQTLNFFQLPELNLGNFSFKGILKEGKSLLVQEMIVGSQTSPVIGQMKGNIIINSFNSSFSKIDFLGELKFSPKVLMDFPVIKTLLLSNKEPNSAGFYPFKLQGTFAKPEFKTELK